MNMNLSPSTLKSKVSIFLQNIFIENLLSFLALLTSRLYCKDDPLSIFGESRTEGVGITGTDPLSEEHSQLQENSYVLLRES